ncbi:hypothetical protein OSB04_020532 [Centaurea solstitialis]|uniref:F-box associated beta-propeller type 3 domain-containing protein n=1 Tax=Centaurea solstitialis TaxID=347529 RepID=A0AA38SU19_9ASTR|nr:hypothetical protein OSB04_020532 [Centaurea solstitialis]
MTFFPNLNQFQLKNSEPLENLHCNIQTLISSIMDSELPHEMIMEILSRTTLKTFDAIVSTNNEFNRLRYDPRFLNLYKHRSNIVSGFLVQHSNCGLSYVHKSAPSQESADLDLGFLSRDSRILAASEQGIVVFETPHRRCHGLVLYHICKPATKQVVALPNPKTRYLTEKVVVVVVGSNPLRYKILRLSKRPNKSVLQRRGELYSTYCCEVFDSATFEWKVLDDIMLPYCVFLRTSSQPINVGGSIYMSLTNDNVLKFDICSDKWTVFPLRVPSDPDRLFEDLKAVKYEGKLALACKLANGGWEIWMNEALERKHVFEEKEDLSLTNLYSFYDSDMSVVVDYDTLVFYEFKKGETIGKVRLNGHVSANCSIFGFRSDFEPVELRRSRR